MDVKVNNKLPLKCKTCKMLDRLKDKVTGDCMRCNMLEGEYDKYVDAALKEEAEGEWILK